MSAIPETALGSQILRKVLRMHWPLLATAIILASVGIVTLHSVAGGSFDVWAERHAVRFLFATAVLLGLACIPPKYLMASAYPFFLMSVVLLCLVPLVGTSQFGAQRWLQIGGVTVQPSELVKVGLVLVLARYYQMLPRSKVSRPVYVALPLFMIAVPMALTLKQPDLGTALLIGVLGLTLVFLSGVSWFYFLGGALLSFMALPFLIAGLHDYQRRRLEVFLNPEQDPLGAGYHIAQSKIALGSGGYAGRGYMQGSQSQLDFLPEKHTDFIFTMIGEEWGFLGTLFVLAVFAAMLVFLFAMAFRTQHQFGRVIVAGAMTTVFVYVAINVAMVMGLMPIVGIPLPLVSYGGTSMITVMVLLGLAMSVHVHRREPLFGAGRDVTRD